MKLFFCKEHYKKKGENTRNGSLWTWLLAGGMALVLFVFTAMVMPISYTYVASDDRFLASYLAGYWTGVPESTLPFINPIFSGFVSSLYRLMPRIHWYADLHIGVMFLSFVLIARSVFVTAKKNKIHWLIACAVNVAIFFAAFCYNIIWLSFTLTPALACAGAAAVVFCGNFKDKSWIADAIISVLLIFIAYIWRSSSALVGICFYACAIVYRVVNIFRKNEGTVKPALIKLGAMVMVLLLLLGIASGFMSAHENDPEYADYYAFRKSCTQYLDYPGALTYEQDPALYNSLGISPYLERLATHWFFMDDAITADAFNTLACVEDPDKIESFMDTHLTFGEALKEGRELFIYDVSARRLVYPCIALFLLGRLMFLWKRKENLLEFILLCGLSVGAFLLCFYLCLLGRFPIRTLATITVGYTVVSALLCGQMYSGGKPETGKHGPVFVLVVCLIAAMIISGVNIAQNVFNDNERAIKQQTMARAEAIEQLATENPDNIYIYDFLLAMSNVAYPDYGDQLPTNLFYWGGSYMGTEAFDRQLEVNNIENFDASLFLQDNVYFVTVDYVGEIHALWPYMIEECNAIACDPVMKLANDSITVYKFRQ